MRNKFRMYNLSGDRQNVQPVWRQAKCTIKLVALVFTFYILHFTFLSTAYAQQANLSLSPATGTFNKGCTFSLDVNLNTGGAQTDGTDAIIIYDTSKFSATSIGNGTVYPEYPGNNIDDTSGRITISGLASVTSAFSGSGKLATLNFTVKDTAPTGATQVTFDFDPQDKTKTTDSNVVQRGTIVDILNSVTNGNYTVGSSSCTSPTTPTNPASGGGYRPGGGTDTGTPSSNLTPPEYKKPYPYKQLPQGANTQLTYTLAIMGSVLVVLGIMGLALL